MKITIFQTHKFGEGYCRHCSMAVPLVMVGTYVEGVPAIGAFGKEITRNNYQYMLLCKGCLSKFKRTISSTT